MNMCMLWIRGWGCCFHMVSHMFHHSLLKILSPLNYLSTFIENRLTVSVRLYFWTLFSSVDLFVCFNANTTPFWLNKFRVRLKFRKCESLDLFLLFKNCFWYSRSFPFLYKITINSAVPTNSLLRFWLRFLWSFRSIWEELTCEYWVFQSLSTRYISLFI